MRSKTSVGSLLLLVAAAACAPKAGVEPPRPIKPADGPDGSIQATFSGGSYMRDIEATFRVDEPAYVMVGHLGGDGRIRVVYPESPRDIKMVEANKSIRTSRIDAGYDDGPNHYSFATAPFRNSSAEYDSYDGSGHGYLFMITSAMPLDFRPVMDGLEFGELDIADYANMRDPRLAIRRVADAVAGEGAYTLKFANALSSNWYARGLWNRCDMSLASSRRGSGFFGPGYHGGLHSGRGWGYPFGGSYVVPIFWSSWSWGMPGSWYVASHLSPFLFRSHCGGGLYAMGYYRVLPIRFVSTNVYPWIEPTQTPPPVTPTLTGMRPNGTQITARDGKSAIDRHTIVVRETNPTRASRPARRASIATNASRQTAAPRTKAASFDRPGRTRVLDESGGGSRSWATRYPARNDWSGFRGAASSGSSSGSGTTASRPASSGSSGSSTSSSTPQATKAAGAKTRH